MSLADDIRRAAYQLRQQADECLKAGRFGNDLSAMDLCRIGNDIEDQVQALLRLADEVGSPWSQR